MTRLLGWLVPVALGMALAGLLAFLWSMTRGQLEVLDGTAELPPRRGRPDTVVYQRSVFILSARKPHPFASDRAVDVDVNEQRSLEVGERGLDQVEIRERPDVNAIAPESPRHRR